MRLDFISLSGRKEKGTARRLFDRASPSRNNVKHQLDATR